MADERLEIQTPEGRREVPIAGRPSISIGRHPENIVIITDPMASRRHCVIENTAKGWQVRDLNSSNGTRLNGQVVTLSRLLPGDIIMIGQTRITLAIPAVEIPADDDEVIDGDGILEEIDQSDPTLSSEGFEPIDESAEVLDEADALGEDDVVSDDDPLQVQFAEDPPPYKPQKPGRRPPGEVEVVVEVEGEDSGGSSEAQRSLRDLAESLPSKPFGQYDIATINSRGVVVHQATPPVEGKARQEAVELLRLLLLVVSRSRATDIHFEPKGEFWQLRIRIDGTMVDVARFPNELGVKLTALVKILGDIDVTQRTIVQEGHFSAKVPGRRIDYRISFAPSVFGQKLVIRVQDTALAPLKVKDLQLPDWMQQAVEEGISLDQGMILVCGPTGSGKTTTLYSLVRSSDTARKNFVTIEDPVEVQIDGVTQIPVDEADGKSFSSLLRSVLRQDPDVIMVGEIRDPETARIAMQAAITGHMVFSTIHTTSTTGTIFRLLDLGVEPYLVAQGLHLIVAQRLVRQLCPFCKKPVKPTPDQLARMPNAGQGVNQIFQPSGCPRCLGTGFWGRTAFFELLKTTDELRDVIVRSPTMQEVQKVLANTRFEKLQQTGFALVAQGLTAFDEIDRAVGR